MTCAIRDQVQLTARAEKLQKDGFFAVLKRKGEPHAHA